MVALKAAIFLALVSVLAWAGLNLAHTAILAWPKWALIEGGGAIGCMYGLTDLGYRWREFIGYRRYDGPRRRMAWGPWR